MIKYQLLEIAVRLAYPGQPPASTLCRWANSYSSMANTHTMAQVALRYVYSNSLRRGQRGYVLSSNNIVYAINTTR